MSPYCLYAFSIQGIQSFIFETNKLREIAGASEFVEQACGELFQEAIKTAKGTYHEEQQIVAAAGKVVYQFKDKAVCAHVARHFLRSLRQQVPELNCSQAVLYIANPKKAYDKKEGNLLQQIDRQLAAHRFAQPMPHGRAWMIAERSRRTGRAGIKEDKIDELEEQLVVIDRGQQTKLDKNHSSNQTLLEKLYGEPKNRWSDLDKLPFETEDLVKSEGRDWLAVVHIDASGLGREIERRLSTTTSADDEIQELSTFSTAFAKASDRAVQYAFRNHVLEVYRSEKVKNSNLKLPIRPILLGGDDLTVLVRGDLAIDFARSYLTRFELETRSITAKTKGLTACAGIAYIKSHYPIHYGVHLAEELCSRAKKVTNRTASALFFHKVHSSFMEKKYTDTIQRLSTKTGVQFDFGPYYLSKNEIPADTSYTHIDQLREWVALIQEKEAPKTSLREWLSELNVDESSAEQWMEQIRRKTKSYYIRELELTTPIRTRTVASSDPQQVTPIYDVLSLASI